MPSLDTALHRTTPHNVRETRQGAAVTWKVGGARGGSCCSAEKTKGMPCAGVVECEAERARVVVVRWRDRPNQTRRERLEEKEEKD